ncbi:SGNH/GDSL hydrolase family protein [Derxia gummosa]|uniref:SGNH/GDSL hydrolase family protein n=1 Tax=Derxia gummosa DSM 723 TaxID=1121388 RepID=A0A8B6X111_9BURK|nr:SGNH/GDSL hydrolase family protein [Derxia gummosa]
MVSRRVLALVGAVCLAGLAACNSSVDGASTAKPSFNRVLSFGDSLSDVGTYAPAVASVGGGKFTTNPGPIWVERIATDLGLTITPWETGGFGAPVTVKTGYGYAQGGARVSKQPGIDCDYVPATDSCAITGPLATPQSKQLDAQLARGNFTDHDLVFLLGGSNDVLYHANLVAAEAESQAVALAEITTAANDQVAQIARVLATGGKYVVTFTLPDVGRAPDGVAAGAQAQALINALVVQFNTQLRQAIATQKLDVVVVDGYALLNDELSNPAKYGFTNTSGTACNPTLTQDTSLLCSSATLVAANADQTYAFADGKHPTTRGHQAIADAVKAALVAKGWR